MCTKAPLPPPQTAQFLPGCASTRMCGVHTHMVPKGNIKDKLSLSPFESQAFEVLAAKHSVVSTYYLCLLLHPHIPG